MAESQTKTTTTVRRGSQPAEILPKLWVGSLASLKFLADHERKSWTVVSVLGSDKLLALTDAMLEDAKATNRCRRHFVWKLADQNNADFFSDRLTKALHVVDESMGDPGGRDVLVHCAMGISRSVTLCAAWMMTRQKLSLERSMEIIRRARPEAMPNMGFVASLRALEASDFDIHKARQRLGKNDSAS